MNVEYQAKLIVHIAWTIANISKSELARKMGINESEVRRILDPNHRTKIDRMEQAANALGFNFNLVVSKTP